MRAAEDDTPYIRGFLQDDSLPVAANDAAGAQIVAEAAKFILDNDGVLHRKVKEASYIDFQFLGDLMQQMCDHDGHLLYQGLANISESGAWWPTMVKDAQQLISACSNCQIYQRQQASRERENADIVTDSFIQ